MESASGMHGAFSYAKINMFLEVTGKRPDGYHDLESVFVEVDLRDRLFARRESGPEVSLNCPGSPEGVPGDGGNLVVKAVEAVRRRCGIGEGMSLVLHKSIPPGTGLGGGSANAALALRLADALWETRLDGDELAELALEIGSDVPFFLKGGTCLCRGRGEIITRLPDFPSGQWIVLALPTIHSGTAEAFRGLRLPGPGERRSAGMFAQALAEADVAGMEREAFNRFEETVFAALPELGRLRTELAALSGRRVRLSGSGSALWHFADAACAASLEENGELGAWARRNGVRLAAVRARTSTPVGSGDIFLDTPPF